MSLVLPRNAPSRARRLVASLVIVSMVAASGPALAQATTPDVDEGKRQFGLGSDRMRDGAYEEALAAFVESNRALPSPNTTLLIARCLRSLGRVEEAVERFEAAAVDAEARALAGETRYQQAASSARAEGAALRATLGVLHLRLVRASSATAVDVDGRRATIRFDGTVDILHRPGEVHYRLLDGDAVRVEGRATVLAGQWTSIDVVVPSKEPVAHEEPARGAAPWVMPTAIGAGVVGLVGLGSFTLFGLRSQSTFNELNDRCAPRCGQGDHDALVRGDREQTIANVSLVIGVIALGAGAALGGYALTR